MAYFFSRKLVYVFIAIFPFLGAFSAYAMIVSLVPFTSQSPFGNWAEPYQDFCEEASVVMVAHWVWNVPLSPAIADREMKIIKQFETLAFQRSKDNSAEDVATILKTLYGIKNVLTKEVMNKQELVVELKQGKIIIVPAAGRMLKNPYFTPPGPFYHMLVVRGHDPITNEFIVNDPGTKRGNGLRYHATVLFNAMHDLNNGDVMNGKKMMIVVRK